MPAIYLTKPMIQSLVQYNKAQIKKLEVEKQYLQHLITKVLWPLSDPFDASTKSKSAFIQMNKAKKDLKVIKKKLKVLAELQNSLKHCYA